MYQTFKATCSNSLAGDGTADAAGAVDAAAAGAAPAATAPAGADGAAAVAGTAAERIDPLAAAERVLAGTAAERIDALAAAGRAAAAAGTATASGAAADSGSSRDDAGGSGAGGDTGNDTPVTTGVGRFTVEQRKYSNMRKWLLKKKDGPKWDVIQPPRGMKGGPKNWVFVKGFSDQTHRETCLQAKKGDGSWFASEQQVALHVVSGDDEALTAAYADFCSRKP